MDKEKIKKMIKKLDDKILEKRSMAIIGTFFLALTLIFTYVFLTTNGGFLFFSILFFGTMTALAFSQVKDSVNPNYPEWPDPPESNNPD